LVVVLVVSCVFQTRKLLLKADGFEPESVPLARTPCPKFLATVVPSTKISALAILRGNNADAPDMAIRKKRDIMQSMDSNPKMRKTVLL